MALITMPRKVYTAALETSDWMRDHGAYVERFVRRGKGCTVEINVPLDALEDLTWHITTLADGLYGESDCSDDVRAMRKWLHRNDIATPRGERYA